MTGTVGNSCHLPVHKRTCYNLALAQTSPKVYVILPVHRHMNLLQLGSNITQGLCHSACPQTPEPAATWLNHHSRFKSFCLSPDTWTCCNLAQSSLKVYVILPVHRHMNLLQLGSNITQGLSHSACPQTHEPAATWLKHHSRFMSFYLSQTNEPAANCCPQNNWRPWDLEDLEIIPNGPGPRSSCWGPLV